MRINHSIEINFYLASMKKLNLLSYSNIFHEFYFLFHLQSTPILRLNLRRTSAEKKVQWNSDTVDNEHMGKKKSKCKRK